MNIVITSGGTREYIDDVRVLTNISSGKLGATIAEECTHNKDYTVEYVTTKASMLPDIRPTDIGTINYHYINTVEELMDIMQELVPKADVVIHAMAVSDFGFDRNKPIKLRSDDPLGFIAHLAATIKMNPKVISYLRKWNSRAILVGFKFTVGEEEMDLIKIAQKLMDKNELDMVFANDKIQMNKNGKHVGYLIMKDGSLMQLGGKEFIAETIIEQVEKAYRLDNIDYGTY